MGRTNPTFRDLLGAVEDWWGPFRRGLRHQDQQRFDQLFADAWEHADAAGYQNPDEPVHAVLLAMLIEQQRRIDELEQQIQSPTAPSDHTPATGPDGKCPGRSGPRGQSRMDTTDEGGR